MRVRNTKTSLEMIGHAENKLVCSMVTALTVTLCNAFTTILDETVDYKLSSGRFYLSKKHLSENAQLLVNVFWCGIVGIARDYPDSIFIEDDQALMS